uniref:Uncharacterized protein n=1 Tax=Phytophthora ramorum TaxID=164328 RepID=H3HCG2_PHYRM
MYAIVIVFKIPFQVIVYSSPLPVAAYAVALLLDGNFMDIYLDSFWSSLEGATNFEFVAFLNSAVTQMRTVWLMALLVDLMVFVARKPSNGSEEKIPGVRGLVISFTSAMTVVGPYKHTFFRNSKVVTAIRSPHAGQNLDVVQSGPQWYFNGSTYLFGDSMTMLLLCIAIVAAVAGTARLMGHLMRMDRDLILISTVNLMNIAMMTDPWNFIWLRVIGVPLYLYRIRPARSAASGLDNSTGLLWYAVILPYPEAEMGERTGLSCDDFELLDSASSRDVPISVLLQCG